MPAIHVTAEFDGRRMPILSAVKRGYAAQGWKFVEIFGAAAPDSLPVTHFSSQRARKITAEATTNGTVKRKIYLQKESLFLTVTMQRPSRKSGEQGNQFVLVFSKLKELKR
jgi:hypothetical protein